MALFRQGDSFVVQHHHFSRSPFICIVRLRTLHALVAHRSFRCGAAICGLFLQSLAASEFPPMVTARIPVKHHRRGHAHDCLRPATGELCAQQLAGHFFSNLVSRLVYWFDLKEMFSGSGVEQIFLLPTCLIWVYVVAFATNSMFKNLLRMSHVWGIRRIYLRRRQTF